MNKEEIDKWLDEEYGCSYTRLEELHDFYFEKYCDLKEENQQLKDRINKAIAYIEKHKQVYDIDGSAELELNEFNILASPKYLIDLLKGDKE